MFCKFYFSLKVDKNYKRPTHYFINRFNASLKEVKLSYFQIFRSEWHYTAGFSSMYHCFWKIMGWVFVILWIFLIISFILCIYYEDLTKYFDLCMILAFTWYAVRRHSITKYVCLTFLF